MKTLTGLFLHPISMGYADYHMIGVQITTWFNEYAKASGREVQLKLMPGTKDADRYFQGNWIEWAKYTVVNTDTITRKLLYDMAIVPALTMGNGAQECICWWLRANRKVYAWNGTKLCQVYGIKVIDSTNFQSGWEAIIDAKECVA